MSVISRKYGSAYSETFTVTLTDYGKSGSDVSDIVFSVKNNETEADDVLFRKRLSLSEISFVGDDVLTVSINWGEAEYSQFTINQTYKAGLGIIWNGETTIDENFNQIFNLKIIQDYFRE